MMLMMLSLMMLVSRCEQLTAALPYQHFRCTALPAERVCLSESMTTLGKNAVSKREKKFTSVRDDLFLKS